MDRDKRWERVKIAVDGLVGGEGEQAKDAQDAVKKIEESYEKDVTDEFLKPIIIGGQEGRIKGKIRHAGSTDDTDATFWKMTTLSSSSTIDPIV